MNVNSKMMIPALLLLLSAVLFAQRSPLERELNRAGIYLEQVTQLVNRIPGLENSDIGPSIRSLLQDARQAYEQAQEFARNNQIVRARLELSKVTNALRQIESLLSSNQNLRQKYAGEAAQAIEELETALSDIENREVYYLLERARLFKQRADLQMADGSIYRAIQYYQYTIYFARQGILILNRDDRTSDNRSFWLSYFNETQNLLSRATQLSQNSDNAELRGLLGSAEKELKRVEDLYNQKDYQNARQRLITVNRALYRILDILESEGSDPQEQIRSELQSLQASIQTLQSRLASANRPAALRVLQRVENLAGQIELSLNQNRIVKARRELLLANQLLVQLYRNIDDRPGGSESALAQGIAEARAHLESLPPATGELQGMRTLMDSNLRLAESSLSENRNVAASFYLKNINLLLLKYNRLSSGEGIPSANTEQATAVLSRLQNLITRAENAGVGEAGFEIRLENARTLKQLAEDALASGKPALGEAIATVAIDLLTR